MVSAMPGAMENVLKSVKAGVRRRYGMDWLQVMPYGGYQTPTSVHVRGRVFIGRRIEMAHQDHSLFRNFRNMARRFLSAEIAQAQLAIECEGRTIEIQADEGGFFSQEIPSAATAPPDVAVRVTEPVQSRTVEAHPRLYGPSPSSRRIVVSDIDDTVLMTRATRAFRMVMLTLFSNAHTRIAFGGVANWYRALQAGAQGSEANPLFYVSSSPWNLYDFLEEFLEVNGIPLGPLFLRDHGLDHGRGAPRGHRGHKLRILSHLLEVYPDHPFLLIGDSGQKDPEIYHELVTKYPGRICGIVIRNVSQLIPARLEEVARFGREIEEMETPFRLVADSTEGLQVTESWGLVEPGTTQTNDRPDSAPWYV